MFALFLIILMALERYLEIVEADKLKKKNTWFRVRVWTIFKMRFYVHILIDAGFVYLK